MRGAGNAYLILIIALMIIAAFMFMGGNFPAQVPPPHGAAVTIAPPNKSEEQKNLQLYTFGYITAAPPQPTQPYGPCLPFDDNGVKVAPTCHCIDASVVCKGGKAFDDQGNALTGAIGHPPLPVSNLCGSHLAPTDGRFCVAKPVIYLYPQKPTNVTVKVETSGKIVVSDPLYPQDGWNNVLADPSGTLLYQGKQYSELFYESEVGEFQKPKKGILIQTKQLSEKLNSILDQLGLVGHEKQEFLDFWVPKLQALHAPYIFFSILDKSEKEKLDRVMISPTPDTNIAFIAYFKPITDPSRYDSSLILPPKPERVGFVSVEWGGSLDK